MRDLLADVGGLTRSVGFRFPEGTLTCVAGIGSDAWDRIFGPQRPAGLHFVPIVDFLESPPGVVSLSSSGRADGSLGIGGLK